MKQLFTIILVCMIGNIHAQRFALGTGLRMEQNFAIGNGSGDADATIRRQVMQFAAPGLHLWKYIGNRICFQTSVYTSKAVYSPQYKAGPAKFEEANLHLTSTNITVEYLTGNPDQTNRLGLFLGLQNVYRRYGTEVYYSSVIDNTYWQRWRWFATTGAGLHLKTGTHVTLYPYAGVRLGLKKQLVYDSKLSQAYAGIAILFALRSSHRRATFNRCPDYF